MKLLDILDQDKDKVKSALAASRTPKEAEDVLASELERLLYRYNESCGDPRLQRCAAQMMNTAVMGLGFLDTAPERSAAEEYGTGQKKQGMRRRTWIMLFAGAACLVLMLMTAFAGSQEQLRLSGALRSLVMAAAGGVLLFLAGRSMALPHKETVWKLPGRTQDDKCAVDTGKTWRALRGMAAAMEQSLNEMERQLPDPEEEKGPAGDESAQNPLQGLMDAELVSSLLEASYSGDGMIALEKLEDFKYALYKKGLTILDFDAETAAYFDVIPAGQAATIRPAILKDGTLLKRGLAAGGM